MILDQVMRRQRQDTKHRGVALHLVTAMVVMVMHNDTASPGREVRAPGMHVTAQPDAVIGAKLGWSVCLGRANYGLIQAFLLDQRVAGKRAVLNWSFHPTANPKHVIFDQAGGRTTAANGT
jgi:hypothetical protein